VTTPKVRVDGLDIAYTDTGQGPTVLFVHGVYVTGAVWNDVMAELGDGFRCIAPTWPLGAHSTPTDGADLGAEAASRRIVHFMEALDLSDVTVVANDTGGGLVLASLGDPGLDTSRIARLVLTNCDSYEHFPPGSFAQIVKLCRVSSRVGGGIVRLLATGPGQSFFLKAVSKHPPSREPVTLTWGTEDQLFPLDHARRLRDAFPHATLIEITDCSAFVMLDAPGKLAEAIRNS
jgi:pimeloyl-ACP methyl ester carboxylesterase